MTDDDAARQEAERRSLTDAILAAITDEGNRSPIDPEAQYAAHVAAGAALAWQAAQPVVATAEPTHWRFAKLPGKAWIDADASMIGVHGANDLDHAAALVLRDVYGDDQEMLSLLPPTVEAIREYLGEPEVLVMGSRMLRCESWDQASITKGHPLDHHPGIGRIKVYRWSL